MKMCINFIFFTMVLIALSKNAHSGLVTGIIGKIHDTIHKVNEDVHNIFKPKEKNNQSQTDNNRQRESKLNEPDIAHSNNEKGIDADKIFFSSIEAGSNQKFVNNYKPDTVTPAYDIRQKVEVRESTTKEIFVFASSPSTPSQPAPLPSTLSPPAPSPSTPSPMSTTTKKEGRENFAAGCSTGYKRTADGRCKPTF